MIKAKLCPPPNFVKSDTTVGREGVGVLQPGCFGGGGGRREGFLGRMERMGGFNTEPRVRLIIIVPSLPPPPKP